MMMMTMTIYACNSCKTQQTTQDKYINKTKCFPVVKTIDFTTQFEKKSANKIASWFVHAWFRQSNGKSKLIVVVETYRHILRRILVFLILMMQWKLIETHCHTGEYTHLWEVFLHKLNINVDFNRNCWRSTFNADTYIRIHITYVGFVPI